MQFKRVSQICMVIMLLAGCGEDGSPSGQGLPPVDSHSPTLAAIGNKVVSQGGNALNFQLSATDPNSLQITFSIDGSVGPGLNPENYGATLGGVNADTFSWDYTQNNAPQGNYSVQITATNSDGYSDSETVAIVINDGSPQLTQISNINASLGATTPVTFTANANDPNGLSVTYSLDGSVGSGTDPTTLGAMISPTSGAFSWDISDANTVVVGSYTMDVIATNSNGQSDSVRVTITVQDAANAQFTNGESQYSAHCERCHGPGGRFGTETQIQCIDSVTFYSKVNGGTMSGYAASMTTQDKADVLYYLNNYDPTRC